MTGPRSLLPRAHVVRHRLGEGDALHERRVYARTRPTLAEVALPAFAAEPADLRAGAWLHAVIRHAEAAGVCIAAHAEEIAE